MLYAGQEGQGFASEAAAALRDWAFVVRGLPTLVSYMAADNHASQAVAIRLGGVLDAQALRSDRDDLVFRYPR